MADPVSSYPFPEDIKRYAWNEGVARAREKAVDIAKWMALNKGITEIRARAVAEAEFSPRTDVQEDSLAYVRELNSLLNGTYANNLFRSPRMEQLFAAWAVDGNGARPAQMLAPNVRLISSSSYSERLALVLPQIEAELNAQMALIKGLHPLAYLFSVYKARGYNGEAGVSLPGQGTDTGNRNTVTQMTSLAP